MSGPPPPPPPCAPPPPKLGAKTPSNNNAKPAGMGILLGEIHKGAKLRKAVTNDRSAPAVAGNKKASPSSKYNTIGVHTNRQQHQTKDTALWRRGSQDVRRLSAFSFPVMTSSKSSFEISPNVQHSSRTSSVPQHSPNQFVAHLKTTNAETSSSHYTPPVSHQNKSSVISESEKTHQMESKVITTSSSRIIQDSSNDISNTSFSYSNDNYLSPYQHSKPYTSQNAENSVNVPSTLPARPLIEQIQSNLKKLKHNSPKMTNTRTSSGNKSNLKMIQGSPFHTSPKAAKTLEQQLYSLRKISVNHKTTSFEPSAPVSEWRQKLRIDASTFNRFSASRLNIHQPGTPRHRSAAMSHFRPVATTNTQMSSYNLTKSSNIIATNSTNILTVAAKFSNLNQQTYPTETKKECIFLEKPQQSYQKYNSPVTGTYESAPVTEQSKNIAYKVSKQPSQQSTMLQPVSEGKPAEFLEVTLKSTRFSSLFYDAKNDLKKDFTPYGNYNRSPYGNPSLSKSNPSNPYVRSVSYHGPISEASYTRSSQNSGSYFQPIGYSFFWPSFMSNSEKQHSENIHQISASAPSLVQSRIQWALNMSSSDVNQSTDIKEDTVRSLVKDRINSWGGHYKDEGKKPNGGSPRGGGGFTPNKIGGMAGELFPGGIPKLLNKGQKQRIPAGNSSPKPVRTPNGPTNLTDIRSQINKNVSNGGSVINDNKTFPQRNVPPTRKFQPPTPHPVNTSNDINSNITNNNHSVNVNTNPSPSQHTAGGIAMNTSGRRMPGSHPPPPPPPPPGRPPSLPNNRTPNKNRPSSMIGRPLPPPPTLSTSSSSSSSSSSLNRAQPPPPPTRGPPLPPDRTVSGSGTLPRSKPPAQRPPPPPPTRPPAGPSSRLMSLNQEGPSPPQRTASSLSTSNIDFSKRGNFHNVLEFPPPEPFTGCAKTYPSRSARNSAGNRRAPPPPPPPPISVVR